MKWLKRLYQKLFRIFKKHPKDQPVSIDQVAKHIHEQVLQDPIYSPQQAINSIQELINQINNNSHMNRKMIMSVHFGALYTCQHMERIPNNMIRGANYSESYPNPYNEARSVVPYTNPKTKDERQYNFDAKGRNKGPKDISAHYLKVNLYYTINNINKMIANGIEYYLGQDVFVTSKVLKDSRLNKYTCKPVTSLRLNYGDDSSVSDQLDNLKYQAVAHKGNALVNVQIHQGHDSKKGSPTGSVTAEVINVKEKPLFKGHYQKDFIHDPKLLSALEKKADN